MQDFPYFVLSADKKSARGVKGGAGAFVEGDLALTLAEPRGTYGDLRRLKLSTLAAIGVYPSQVVGDYDGSLQRVSGYELELTGTGRIRVVDGHVQLARQLVDLDLSVKLASALADAKRRIEAQRSQVTFSDLDWIDGETVRVVETSRPETWEDLGGLATALGAGIAPPLITWRFRDNEMVELNGPTFLSLAAVPLAHKQSCYTVSWVHKAALATIVEDPDLADLDKIAALQAYDEAAGWPSIAAPEEAAE